MAPRKLRKVKPSKGRGRGAKGKVVAKAKAGPSEKSKGKGSQRVKLKVLGCCRSCAKAEKDSDLAGLHPQPFAANPAQNSARR